ncbi:MAG: hypothetical protein R2939_00650 [Kofleriaceae bacterium]
MFACAFLPLVVACAVEDAGDGFDHDEPSDLDPVPPGDGKADAVSAVFDRNLVVTDAVFTDAGAIDGDGLQAFFEDTPYHTRSWLADHQIDGRRFADALVDVAVAHGLHPVMLLARMQVEKSIVSKTERPSQRTVDFAFGCGCPDNQPCNEAYRGLDKQVACAADVLRTHFDGSVDGTGQWQLGVARKTLDPITITPRSHATAALYAYTPWVLQGQGGNWLVWNVTRRYLVALEEAGLLTPPPEV